MKVSLPILFLSDENRKLKDAGMEYDIRKDKVRKVTFYEITCSYRYEEQGLTFTLVRSGGEDFVCTLSPDRVEQIISSSLITGLNYVYADQRS